MPSSARSCKRLQECSRRPRKRKAHLTERSVNEVRISTLWQRGASDDQIDGEARDDETQGLAGDDRFDGGPGDDRIDGSGRLDVCTGGTGNDTSLTAISYAVSRSRNGDCTSLLTENRCTVLSRDSDTYVIGLFAVDGEFPRVVAG